MFPLGSNVFAKVNGEENSIVLNSSGEILTLRAESASASREWVGALQDIIPIELEENASKRVSKINVHAHFASFIPGKRLKKSIQAVESPSIECDIDIYASPKPFAVLTPTNLNSPKPTKHAYAESLTQEAWLALQSDSFRGSRARMVSTCSSLGDGFITPLSFGSAANIFDFPRQQSEDIPPCPLSPPPFGGDVMDSDEYGRVDAPSPSIEVAESQGTTEFQRKWMEIRKRSSLPT